jgi:hypothetical protein
MMPYKEDMDEEDDAKYNLLPAGVYASIMGRHLIDAKSCAVRFDWPGVRLSFHVKGTTFVSIRIQTAGSVFGYRVYPVTELGDELNTHAYPQKHYEPNNPKKHQQQLKSGKSSASSSSPPEMLLGGPGGLFNNGGKVVQEYALAVGLDPFLHYKIDVWKRDDPTGRACIIEGLYVDKPHGMGVLQEDFDDNDGWIDNHQKIDTLSPLYAALQAQQQQQQSMQKKMKKKKKVLNLEFVGNSDTVGFGNLTTMSSKLYYTLCQASCLPLFRRLYEGTDVTQAWPAFLSRALSDSVNYSVVAWSGVGAKYSMSMPESMTMLYPRVLACDAKTCVKTDHDDDDDDAYNTDDTTAESSGGEGGGGTWNKNNNKSIKNSNCNNNALGPADAVLVYIGQNDKVRMANHRASNTKLSAGYEELLTIIRQHRPRPIPIIVIVPTLNAYVTGVSTESQRLETCAIQHELWSHLVLYKLGGPANGFYLVENSHMPADLEINSPRDFGMNLHWNVESQRKWALGLVPQIRQVLDEVGATSSASTAVTAASMSRQPIPYHGNFSSNKGRDAPDDDDDDINNKNDAISSQNASSGVLVTMTTAAANPMIAACTHAFSCLAPECESSTM